MNFLKQDQIAHNSGHNQHLSNIENLQNSQITSEIRQSNHLNIQQPCHITIPQ